MLKIEHKHLILSGTFDGCHALAGTNADCGVLLARVSNKVTQGVPWIHGHSRGREQKSRNSQYVMFRTHISPKI